jgi:ribosomal protein S18 acetylase RimI-like enzyme
MVTPTHQIVRLEPARVANAASVAARAFADDPMFTYIFPDPARRMAPLRRFLIAGLRYGTLFGDVHTTDDGAGTALWLTPGQGDITALRMLRSGMAALPITIGPSAFRRFLNLATYGDQIHASVVREPHWYLLNLAVDPRRQRQGIGSALMEPVLALADRNRQRCYLETNNPTNFQFYANHGFEIAQAGHVPGDGPAVWALIRRPRIGFS